MTSNTVDIIESLRNSCYCRWFHNMCFNGVTYGLVFRVALLLEWLSSTVRDPSLFLFLAYLFEDSQNSQVHFCESEINASWSKSVFGSPVPRSKPLTLTKSVHPERDYSPTLYFVTHRVMPVMTELSQVVQRIGYTILLLIWSKQPRREIKISLFTALST